MSAVSAAKFRSNNNSDPANNNSKLASDVVVRNDFCGGHHLSCRYVHQVVQEPAYAGGCNEATWRKHLDREKIAEAVGIA